MLRELTVLQSLVVIVLRYLLLFYFDINGNYFFILILMAIVIKSRRISRCPVLNYETQLVSPFQIPAAAIL